MKKFLQLFPLLLLSIKGYCQPTSTIAIQYYVDANNNCTYNPGEQLIYNVPTSITYSQINNGPVTWVYQQVINSCSNPTLYCSSPLTPAANTIVPLGSGITPNLTCGNYTNLPYNTNTVQYLPVILTGTSNLGVQTGVLNYFSSIGNTYQEVASGSTIGLCSNFGMDSLNMAIIIFNFLSCTTNTLSSRTYSFYFDNVLYDQFTITSGINTGAYSATGVNNNVVGWEDYGSAGTSLNVQPKFPATFSVVGTHTFDIKSSMIYNNAVSVVNFVYYLNSIPCAKISGRFYNDCNNNCTFDSGDSYGVGQQATGLIYNGNGTNVTFNPNPYDGKFSVYLPSTSAYSLTQYPTTPGSFTACQTSTITIPAAAATNTFLFGYKSNAPANADPGVILYRVASTATVISPLVGITFGYQINNYWWNLCNSSSVINPGKLKITLPKFINYVSTLSGLTPTFSAGSTMDTLIYAIPDFSNNINWSTTPLGTFSAVISATAVANTPCNVTAYIYPTLDIDLQNNTHAWWRVIGGPFDPNGKYTQVPGMNANGDIPFGTQDFIYEIGFQNVGNAPAINVTTLDTIDTNFDLNSLRVLQSSFPVSLQTNNVSRTVGFHFNNISLPGSQVNEPASHGFVRYSIKLKPNVPVNTILKNRAHNYFDFLAPVATNQTSNKLVIASAMNENGELVRNVRAVPNPFSSKLSIECADEINGIKVFNLAGQLLLDIGTVQGTPVVDMENFSAGVYLVKVRTQTNQVSTIKVIKE